MKCLESEKLVGYAYRLLEESDAAEGRRHLEACPACRKVVEQHGRLDAVLSEWKSAEPTPAFDVRVRQAVEADQARRQQWGFHWVRTLALASLGLVIIAVAVGLSHHQRVGSRLAQMAAGQKAPAAGAALPVATTNPQGPPQSMQANATPVKRLPNLKAESVPAMDDRDAQAIEDYDLAANFDLLSEIPKRETRVAN